MDHGDVGSDEALAAAVDDALIGDVLADLPEAQPGRTLHSATDFSSLYIRHRSGLAAHARRYLRDARDVDEVVQETFLRLFLAISEIETELQAIAFARRTLTNLCIDRYRAERRRPTLITLDANPNFDVTSAEEDPDPVLQAEDAAIVRDALARLSPLHRAALVKREIEEKPLPQIAAELGVAEDSVKHLLFRARRALRRLLVGTSVEPGVDLSAGELLGVVNRRLGTALSNGTGVFVLIVIVSVVAAIGLRPLFTHHASAVAGAPTAPSLPSLATTAPPPPPAVGGTTSSPAAGARHGGSAAGSSATTGQPGAAASPVVPPAHPIAPTHEPTHNGAATGSGDAHRGHFRLSGPLQVRGAPQVSTVSSAVQADKSTQSVSTFTADTSEGTFVMTQAVDAPSDGGATVSVQPHFIVGDMAERPNLTGSTARISTAADGSMVVDVNATAAPDPSTNAFPLTALAAHFVLSPELDVVEEAVTLSTTPPPSPQPVATTPASPPATTGPPPPPPAETTPSAEATPPPAQPTPSSGTSTQPAPSSSAATPPAPPGN